MRFFISANIKKNTPLYYAVLFFLVFALLFWLASWVHFYSKYGFSYESLVRYFFMDPDFPERVSIAQVSEDFHVGVFIHGMLLITLFSLLNITALSKKVKLILITSTSLFALLFLLSDFLILLLGTKTVMLKLLSFLAYQLNYLITWLLTTLYILRDEQNSPKTDALKLISLAFALFSLFFLFSNFLNFHAKMGFGVEGIRNYFLGNPDLFVKGKSFKGVFKVFYPHLIAMAVYSLALAHLLPFAGVKRRTALWIGIFLFVFSFLDNLTSLLLLFLGSPLAYLKLLSFWSFQLLAVGSSLMLLVGSLKGGEGAKLYL
ncbi:MAG: hypothetical protein WKI46_00900 [Aquificaceae bacterium]